MEAMGLLSVGTLAMIKNSLRISDHYAEMFIMAELGFGDCRGQGKIGRAVQVTAGTNKDYFQTLCRKQRNKVPPSTPHLDVNFLCSPDTLDFTLTHYPCRPFWARVVFHP